MKNGVNILILAAAVLVAACTPKSVTDENGRGGAYAPVDATVTIGTLLDEMVSREELAEYPSPEYTAKQFSSYDRASSVKDGPGWYDNGDNSKFLRYEEKGNRTEYVMFDAKGPGAITRWWMTFAGENCGTGLIRVYIDGNEKPAIVGSAFEVLSGKRVVDGILGTSVSDLSPYENRGHNLYYPIPYSKSCKITYDSANLSHDAAGNVISKESVYYNIVYRTYQSGTSVASYSADEVKYYKAKTQEVSTALTKVNEPAVEEEVSLDAVLKPGERKSVTISGENAIKLLSMRLIAQNKEQALRSTVLSIEFDGQKKVWVPVGEFYRIGYKQLDMRSWYVKANVLGQMSAYWVMPFKKNAVITIINAGEQEVKITDSRVGYSSYSFGKRSMYFGVDWHLYPAVNTRVSPINGVGGSVYDVNFTTLFGKGVYVGDGVTLFNTAAAWWGEGDEKVYVDGEDFPSHFGTGTEDYYGYAWCRPEMFTGHPFIAQPDGSGDLTPGYTVNTRFRGLDGIPFKKSLVFDMELWHWAECIMDYAVTTFHYMLPGGTSAYGEDFGPVKRKVTLSAIDLIPMDENAFDFEAEFSNKDKMTGGNFELQTAFSELWSRGCQVFWNRVPVGSELVISFESPYVGTYDMSIQYAVSFDYGKFDIWFNDRKLESNTDFYSAQVATKVIDYGAFELKNGKNIFRVVAKGTAPGMSEAFFGVDKFIFKKK